MDINVYDKTNTLIACRDCDQFVFSEQYQDLGDFEITTNLTQEALDTYKPDYIVQIGEKQEAGIIETINIDFSEDVPTVSIKGRLLLSILERRIIKDDYTRTGTASEVISNLILYLESIPARAMGISFINDLDEQEEDYTYTFKGTSYSSAILDIAQTSGYGIKVLYNPDSATPFEIHLHNGVNKSINQSTYPPVILSTDYANISSIQYEYSNTDFANVCYVSGYNQIQEIGTATGLDRKEIYTEDTTTATEDFTEQEKERRLKYQGLKELSLHSLCEALTGDILNNENDYAIGDIVSIEEPLLGLYTDLRVREITYSQTEAGYAVSPTLAN